MAPNLELAGVAIPGPVILAYMIAFFLPPQPSDLPRALPIPKPSIKKADWKLSVARVQVPVVCGACLAVQGSMEGGRLNANCWRCQHDNSIHSGVWWRRLGTVNNLVPEDWATDPLACLIIKEVLEIRSNQL